jgi:replication factor C subunit 3/5
MSSKKIPKETFIDIELLNERHDLPWTEKYRPKTFEHITGQDDNLDSLNRRIENNNFPNSIFYGPPGTGKTTTAHACGFKLYGDDYDIKVLELNSSDERGINVVREQIKEFTQTKHFYPELNKNKPKLIILDEADSMTFEAQAALKNVIENSIPHARFCLICNYAEKIMPSLQSRCSVYRFTPIENSKQRDYLLHIIMHEGINVDDDVIDQIVNMSEGDMRKSINVLHSLYMSFEKKRINLEMFYKNACQPLPIEKKMLIDTIKKNSIKEAYHLIDEFLRTKSLSLNDIINIIFTSMFENKKISEQQKAEITIKLARLEQYLAGNINPRIQLGAIICALK